MSVAGNRLMAWAWALVSEPGVWDFQISRFSIIEICFCNRCLENLVVRYRGINNKGVLERPWTKWGGFESHFWHIEIPIYRQMLKSGLSDAM